MIQRIQTLYLLAIAAIGITLILADIPYYQETGRVSAEYEATTITVDYNSTELPSETVSKNNLLIYFLGAISLVSLVTIFLYKNRKLQIRLVFGVLVLLVVLLAGMYAISFGNHYTTIDTHQSVMVGVFIPFSMVIFGLLAYQRIKKDDKLVRSLDRIR